ncbi:hypothetical protein ACFQX8_22560 [Klenkia terrae]|uniref:hypothetical protein n=1 Tax=Klenkia terrae TaxID=1052259 RepID=UPI00360D552A
MTSIFDPRVPAAAFDEFLVDALPAAREQRSWTEADGALPSLYLSHGAPPLFDDGPWMRDLHTWALSMPKPKDVLIVSAHWESAPSRSRRRLRRPRWSTTSAASPAATTR